jgi:hypothetical protein
MWTPLGPTDDADVVGSSRLVRQALIVVWTDAALEQGPT